jgi:hypothetical protein
MEFFEMMRFDQTGRAAYAPTKFWNSRPRLAKLAAPLLFTLGVAATSAEGAIVYGFGHSSEWNAPLNGIGWNGYYGSDATAVGHTGEGNRSGSASGVGPDSTKGYLYSATETQGMTFALYSNDFASAFNADSFSWKMGNNSTVTVQVLIKQGGSWYVSTDLKSTANIGSAATFAASPEQESLTFSLGAANWRNFTFDPGLAMGVGTALTEDLPSNAIDAVGFYVTHGGVSTTTMRLDDLAINGVPEPTSALLAGLGVAVVSLRRRR